MSFLAEYFLFKKAADHHRWGSAYPLHPSPRSAPDHNYFIEASEREGSLGMSILHAVVDVGRDCRSNEIKPNRIKCRFLVGGKTVSAGYLVGKPTATHSWCRGRNRTQTTLIKACALPSENLVPTLFLQRSIKVSKERNT